MEAGSAEVGGRATELAEAERQSREGPDMDLLLAEWRAAERAVADTDPESPDGRRLRYRAEQAREAFHEAEDAQRERHGYDHAEPSDERSRTTA
jgi:hypothetical protein